MNIFVDTNFFVNYNLDFKNKNLQEIQKYIKSNNHIFTTTDIHIRELQKKIADMVESDYSLKVSEDTNGKTNKNRKEATELRKIKKQMREQAEDFKKSLIKNYINELYAFIESMKPSVMILTTEKYIDLMEIMELYSKQEPPFSIQKSKEFVDAFILEALKKYAVDFSENIHIISKDKDFESFCNECEYLEYYEGFSSLKDEFLRRDEENYNLVLQILRNDVVLNDIIQEVKTLELDTDQLELLHDGSFEYVDITDVDEITEVKLTDLEYEEGTITCYASLKAEVNFIFKIIEPDRDTMARDSETGDLFYINKVEREWDQSLLIPLEITFKIKNPHEQGNKFVNTESPETEDLFIKLQDVYIKYEDIPFIDSDNEYSIYY